MTTKHEKNCDCYRCEYDDEVVARAEKHRREYESDPTDDNRASMKRAAESARIYLANHSTRTY